jgi:hypothetical protein
MEKNEIKKGRILGLDVSTKTIGISLFESDGKLLELTHITSKIKPQPTKKLEELFRKVDSFEKLLTRYMDLDIERVIIEEPLLNSNNVYTVGVLLKFNGMISKVVDDVLGVTPDFISSYDARAYGFPELLEIRKFDKKGKEYSEKEIQKKKPVLFGSYPYDVDKKQVIFNKVADREPQISWLYDKYGKVKKECYDQSDAYTAVLGYMRKNKLWP